LIELRGKGDAAAEYQLRAECPRNTQYHHPEI
jgi:hypothetical protein